MDRKFDSQYGLQAVSDRGLKYVDPKRMQTSEKAQAKRRLQQDEDFYVTDRTLHPGNDEWHPTTLVYKRKQNSKPYSLQDREGNKTTSLCQSRSPGGAYWSTGSPFSFTTAGCVSLDSSSSISLRIL